jgi:predicted metalloendopeptidase
MSPYVNWDVLFQSHGIQTNEIVLQNVQYVYQMFDLYNRFDIEQWKTYMKWHMVKNAAQFLPTPIENENFAFFSTFIIGVSQQKPLEERAVRNINMLL